MKWTIFGKRPNTPAPSWTPVILAFIFASQTFSWRDELLRSDALVSDAHPQKDRPKHQCPGSL